MKIRNGFVSNSSSSSFIVTREKINEVSEKTFGHAEFEPLKPEDRESVLRGIIKRAQQDIDVGYFVESSQKQIDRANAFLNNNKELYVTDQISDGYWTDDFFFEDPEIIEYIVSCTDLEHRVDYGNGNVELMREDCRSIELDISELTPKRRAIMIDLYNELTFGNQYEPEVTSLNVADVSNRNREIIVNVFNSLRGNDDED